MTRRPSLNRTELHLSEEESCIVMAGVERAEEPSDVVSEKAALSGFGDTELGEGGLDTSDATLSRGVIRGAKSRLLL